MITVIGSYAVGMTMIVKRFPVGGETVFGHDFSLMHGGKGSNQAIGCVRMGADVFFHTCLGKDQFAKDAQELFVQEKIDASLSKYSDDKATAVGFVTVCEDGENEIAMDYGACAAATASDIDAAIPMIKKSAMVVTQLEMSKEAVVRVAQICKEEGVTLLLNPAPYKELPKEVYECCSYITPNETEARAILGLPSDDSTPNEEIAERLIDLGVDNVVMTMGGSGAMIADKNGCRRIKGKSVKVVDSTGAGDTFTAGLAVALSEGKTLEEAVAFANAAGALAVTKYGVVDGIPYRNEVDALLKK